MQHIDASVVHFLIGRDLANKTLLEIFVDGECRVTITTGTGMWSAIHKSPFWPKSYCYQMVKSLDTSHAATLSAADSAKQIFQMKVTARK